jgi:hypothetical protein
MKSTSSMPPGPHLSTARRRVSGAAWQVYHGGVVLVGQRPRQQRVPQLVIPTLAVDVPFLAGTAHTLDRAAGHHQALANAARHLQINEEKRKVNRDH